MGKLSKTKGRRNEQIIVNILKPVFPNAGRNWAEQFQRQSGRDFLGTDDFVMQLKSGKRPDWKASLQEAIDEIIKLKNPSLIPIGITKEDRSEAVVHMLLVDFLKLYEAVKESKEKKDGFST